jgi:hypothetical protein
MGEDLDPPNKRVEVAADFGLGAVEVADQREATPLDEP